MMKLIIRSLVAATVLLCQSAIASDLSSDFAAAAAAAEEGGRAVNSSSKAPTSALRGTRSASREDPKQTARDLIASGRGQKSRQLDETCFKLAKDYPDDVVATEEIERADCNDLGDCINEYYCAAAQWEAVLLGRVQCQVGWGVLSTGATDCPWEYFCCNYVAN